MRINKKIIGGILFFILFVFIILSSHEKKDPNFPEKPFKLIVGFQENGGSDRSAKFLKDIMKDNLTLKIENIPGDSGIFALNQFKNSKDSIYTLAMINYPSSYYNSYTEKYNIDSKDFDILFSYIYDVGVLVVGEKSEIKDFEDFKKLSKSRDFTIGENGIGASDYIAAKLITKELGIDPKFISFSNSSQIIEALKNGYIDSAFLKESEIIEEVENKKLKGILALSDEKLNFLSDIPLSTENNLDIKLGSLRAIAVKKNTPNYVKKYLLNEFSEKLKEKTTKNRALEKNIPFSFKDKKETMDFINRKDFEIKKVYN